MATASGGKTHKSCQLLMRGERISVIAAMTSEGVQKLKASKQHSGWRYIPRLYCVVILDNCSVHHVSGVESMITEVGALVHYLPPYSPDWNPIEEAFSKVKAGLKSTEGSFSDDLETAVLAAFTCITPEHCLSWIRDSGMYIS